VPFRLKAQRFPRGCRSGLRAGEGDSRTRHGESGSRAGAAPAGSSRTWIRISRCWMRVRGRPLPGPEIWCTGSRRDGRRPARRPGAPFWRWPALRRTAGARAALPRFLSIPRMSPGGRCRTALTQASNPAVAQYPTMPAIDRLNPGNVLDRTGSSGSNTRRPAMRPPAKVSTST
jgi:hypothetical protein